MYIMTKQQNEIINNLKDKYPHEPQFHQTVEDLLHDILPYIQNKDSNGFKDQYYNSNIIERLLEPDRIIQFRVSWQTQTGEIKVNRGWRVQHSNAIGPYKGGLRFHPEVSLDTFKFLAFEQTFKNALTGMQMGGGKGGSDFNPKEYDDVDIMNFCHAFMVELYRYIGPHKDVPAGDIGVGEREIGYLFGMYKKIVGRFDGAMTGKNPAFGGSCIREEATGYGCVYFLESALQRAGENIEGKVCALSGAGNVAIYAANKLIEKGAKVITLSDSQGMLYSSNGFSESDLKDIKKVKIDKHGALKDLKSKNSNFKYYSTKSPWDYKCDIAIPCATQNELDKSAAKKLKDNATLFVCEAANMPLTSKATALLRGSKTQILPSKAVNAGGVAVSGLERTQNAQYLGWAPEKVDQHLSDIMQDIHELCVKHGANADDTSIDYIKGANIAGFERVAKAMLAYGSL